MTAVGADALVHVVGGDRDSEPRVVAVMGRALLAHRRLIAVGTARKISPQGGNDMFHRLFLPHAARPSPGAG